MSIIKKLAEDDSDQLESHDPEAIDSDFFSDDDTTDTDDVRVDEGRSHYASLGQSSLRAKKVLDLGPKYSGTAIDRNVFDQSLPSDSDNSQMNGDPVVATLAPSSGFLSGPRRFVVSKSEFDSDADATAIHMIKNASRLANDASAPAFDQAKDEIGRKDDSEVEIQQDFQDAKAYGLDIGRRGADRAAFQNIARQNKDDLRQSLSDAVHADARKGRAINTQRSTFNSLLSLRMGLQKGLAAANSLSAPASQNGSNETSEDHSGFIEAAEKAAESLFTRVTALQAVFLSSSTKLRGVKRSFDTYARQSLGASFESLQMSNSALEGTRRSVVNRWAHKTAPMSTQAGADRLRARAVQQPMASLLDAELASSSLDRLVARSRMPRSCAPLHANEQVTEDNVIYDDADWYALLLRELVEGKTSLNRSHASNQTLPTVARVDEMRRENKTHRVNVDVKASKGRKLNFTVQEKIQNFLAPDDRSTWGDKQITELFGSLMGHRIRGGLNERNDISEDVVKRDYDTEAGALRLFGA